MKLFGLLKKYCFIFFVIVAAYSNNLLGMTFEEGIIARGLEEGLEEGILKETLETGFRDTFGIGLGETGELENFFKQAAEDAQLSEKLGGLKDSFQKFKAGEITQGELQTEVNKVLSPMRENFISKLDEAQALTPKAAEKISKMPSDIAGIGARKPVLPEDSMVPTGISHGELPTGPALEAQKAFDELQVAKGEFESAAGSEKASKEAAYKQAQSKYDEAVRARDEAAAKQQTKAQQAVDEAKNVLDQTAQSGSGEKIANADKSLAGKEEEAAQATKEGEKAKRQTWRQKYEEAKAERDAAKKAWDEAAPDEKEAKQAAYEEAQLKYKQAKEDFINNAKYSDWKRNWVSSKEWAKEKAISAFTNVAAGIEFAIPNMITEAWQGYNQRQVMYDNLKKVQIFGGIHMKLVPELLNENDPQNSRFIYYSLSSKDENVTQSQQQYANYYVSISEYGDIAKVPVFDPSCSMMLHCNSGMIFTSNGEPVDDEFPNLCLLCDRPFADDKAKNTLAGRLTLPDALNEVASQASGVKEETTIFMFFPQKAGFKGSDLIKKLMSSGPDTPIPPLIQPTVDGLQKGTYFGGMKVSSINPIKVDNITFLSKASASPSATYPTQDARFSYPAAKGIYIYQTQDTPFIKNMLNNIPANDPNAQTIKDSLYDYVVFINNPDEPTLVPLQIPLIEKKGFTPRYVLNPNAKLMVSLVEPEIEMITGQQLQPKLTMYNLDGSFNQEKTLGFDQYVSWIEKNFSTGAEWANQITLIRNYIAATAKKGPFKYANATLEPVAITNLPDKPGIPIYRIAKFLEDGSDDYVVSLLYTDKVGQVATMLPRRIFTAGADDQQRFVSLVTSRFYTTAASTSDPTAEMIIPLQATVDYWIVKEGDATSITMTKPASSVATGKAPLYTLFVDQAFNPTLPKFLPPGYSSWPTGEQWALNHIRVLDPSKSGDENTAGEQITIEQLLENNASDANFAGVQNAIATSYNAWKTFLKNKYPEDLDSEYGPFTWVSGAMPILMTASSKQDLLNNIYVYTSADYPGQYLVMSNNKSGISGTQAFDVSNPQQYAISLSNGDIYDRMQDGVNVDKPLDFNTLLKNTGVKPDTDIYKAIIQSQAAARRKKLEDLAPAFGSYNLYLREVDYDNQLFIYGIIPGQGNPFTAQGEPNDAVIKTIKDYVVAVNRVPEVDDKGNIVRESNGSIKYKVDENGNPVTEYGQVGEHTYWIASLITGAWFTPTGYFGTPVNQVDISSEKPGGDCPIFTKAVLSQLSLEKKDVATIDPTLYASINQLSKDYCALYNKEIDQIKKEEQAEQTMFAPMDADILNNLMKVPYDQNENPSNLPRYLKLSGGKYYMVTPDPGDDKLLPPQTIIDYNFDPASPRPGSDTGIGMMYQVIKQNGQLRAQPQQRLEGWALVVARAFAGVFVGSNGDQKLVMRVIAPEIPMKFKTPEGKDAVAIQDTGIAGVSKTYPNITTQFYYNQLMDSYFAYITDMTKASYYADFTSGICYDWDSKSQTASPRLNQSPLYAGADGDYLFAGQDQFNTLKFSLNPQPGVPIGKHQVSGGVFQSYSQYWSEPDNLIFNDIRTGKDTEILKEQGKRGSLFNFFNDYGGNGLKVGYVYKDPSGTKELPPAEQHYIIWETGGISDRLIDKYDRVADRFYSLLTYQQTRAIGQSMIDGKYVEADGFHQAIVTIDEETNEVLVVSSEQAQLDPNARQIPLIKFVGIVFDTAGNLKGILYNGQYVALSGSATAGYKGTYQFINKDNTTTAKNITVTLSTYKFPNSKDSELAVLPAKIVSITDEGTQKIYDYMYDYHIIATAPPVTAEQQAQLNLYTLKREWKVNVSNFIPNIFLQSVKTGEGTVINSPTGRLGSTALVGQLSALSSAKAPAVTCPTNAGPACQKELDAKLAAIKVYSNSHLFIPNAAVKKAKFPQQFIYKLGGHDWDNDLGFYSSYLNGYSVDLSLGILYYPPSFGGVLFPVGIALLPSQLSQLLDVLHLTVHLDKDGYPDSLEYRSIANIDEGQKAAAVTPHLAAAVQKQALPAAKPMLHSVVVPKKAVKKAPVKKARTIHPLMQKRLTIKK